MKNTLLRILCGTLCTALLCTSTAFAEEPSQESEKETEAKTEQSAPAEEKKGLRYDEDAEFPVYAGYTPDYSNLGSYQYDLFMEILTLYTETHLFEFSKEEATEAFLMKLMKENPDLMKMFIDTLLTTMDPYSGYYEAGTGIASDGSSKAYGMQVVDHTNGNIMSMGLTEKGLYIMNVMKDSPADKAGLKVGDRLVAVEGIPLKGLPRESITNMLAELPYVEDEQFDSEGNSLGIPNEPEFIITNEEKGTKEYVLHFDVERNGETISVALTKDRVKYTDIVYERSPDKTYSYIGINSFSDSAVVEDFKVAIEKAKKESQGNLLIDLRNNSGGKGEYVIEMANMLIDEKDRVLCYFNARDLEKPEAVYSSGDGYKFEKVTVLINENSASAAEIFAMTLRYNCEATLIGKTTFGKGVGQQPYTFTSGDMFAITQSEVLDPLKRSYHNTGIVPDVEIDLCLDKYQFPEGVLEFVFTPNAETANTAPTATEGEVKPCMKFEIGEESENILALEQRLEILNFMYPEYVDGKFDDVTLAALKSYELYIYGKPEGVLDEREARLINSMAEKYKNYYYQFDSQYEVAVMSFKSRSQAKRRAKELTRASDEVTKEYEAYLKAEEERIKAEEKAEAEAEAEAAAKAEAEAAAGAEATTEATTEATAGAEANAEATTEATAGAEANTEATTETTAGAEANTEATTSR